MIIKDLKIDKSWTLFLDRDGVINKRIVDEYVLEWSHFEFIPGVMDALKIFSAVFGKIIIVTNQQGIGRGLMTEKDLLDIHNKMTSEIEKNGGRVDAIFFAPQTRESKHFDRKPNVGMALKAKKSFPEINFKRSVMAGDSITDMEFGHRLGMTNIIITEDRMLPVKFPKLINFMTANLKDLAEQINDFA
jgi:D-glycero-D-manno-heptose 1,7-bisphosphate phosphatase